MKNQCWLWPDRQISKTESRELREEHNALVNAYGNALDVLMDAEFLLRKAGINPKEAPAMADSFKRAAAAAKVLLDS